MRVYRIMFSILDLFLTTFTRLMLCGRDPVKVVKGWRSPYYKHIKQVMDFSVFIGKSCSWREEELEYERDTKME